LTTDGISLSIIIPAYNRLTVLQELLGGNLSLVDREDVETIIVDDGSSDGTWEWLTEFCDATRGFRCYRTDVNSGPGQARNIGLDHARGKYFLACDSDVLPMPGAIDRICSLVETHSDRNVIFVPCIEYPSLKRMDPITGDRDISSEDMLYGRISAEMIPIGRLPYFNERNLRYPTFRSGGEGILWIQATAEKPALFADGPLFYYRTDVSGRICTADHQLRHAGDMAKIADAMIALYPDSLDAEGAAQRARRRTAAGMYHLLAGNTKEARARLRNAAGAGNVHALILLCASLFGVRACRAGFSVLRRKSLPAA
jgi:glycosyltransferase involved in cell wall biosynthesis